MLFGDLIGDFGKVRQLSHGRKAEKLLDVGWNINSRVRSVRDDRDCGSQKHETEKEHERIAKDAGVDRIPGSDGGGGRPGRPGPVPARKELWYGTVEKGMAAIVSDGCFCMREFSAAGPLW